MSHPNLHHDCHHPFSTFIEELISKQETSPSSQSNPLPAQASNPSNQTINIQTIEQKEMKQIKTHFRNKTHWQLRHNTLKLRRR